MTTRRDLLTGTVAVIAAPLLPIPAMAAPVDDAELFALAERRQILDATANARPPGLTNEETEARVSTICDAMIEIEDEMAEYQAATLAGAVLKLRIAFEIMPPSENYSGGRLTLSAFDDLEALAKEARI